MVVGVGVKVLVGVVVGVAVRVEVGSGVEVTARVVVGGAGALVGFAVVARAGAVGVGVGGTLASALAQAGTLTIALRAMRNNINCRIGFDSREGISRRKYNTRHGRIKIERIDSL